MSNRDLLKQFADGTPLGADTLQSLSNAKLIVSLMPGRYVLTTAGRILLNDASLGKAIEVGSQSLYYKNRDRNVTPPGDSASCPDEECDLPTRNPGDWVEVRAEDLLNPQARARLNAVTAVPSLLAGKVEQNTLSRGALEMQVGGGHYKDMVIQPVEFIEKNGIRFLEGCIIKRAARHDKKTGAGAQDLRKIIHEATLLLQLRYGEKP